MHVEQSPRACALVQIVDILGHQQQLAGPFGVEPPQRLVGGIGLDRGEPRPARVVESVHQRRIAGEGFGRRDILDAMPFPQAVGAAESGEAAFRRYSGARQDHDVVHGPSLALMLDSRERRAHGPFRWRIDAGRAVP